MSKKFKLRRQIDGLVYYFEKISGVAKGAIYERSDAAVRIHFDPHLGWISFNPTDGIMNGRVWDTPVNKQGDYPTEGMWISQKGDKSYVYKLEYENSP